MNKCFLEIDKDIKIAYTIPSDKFVQEFLNPVLKRAKTYKRLTYSFSSGIITLISESLNDIINNEAKLFYVTGLEIKEEDARAIEIGREEDANFYLEKQIENEFGKIETFISGLGKTKNKTLLYEHRLKALSFLISKGTISIKVGLRINADGKIANPEHCKFHPKVMVFEDFDGHKIVGNGSGNEGIAGSEDNAETTNIFKSWKDDSQKEYVKYYDDLFTKYWENQEKTVKSIDVIKIIEKGLIQRYKQEFKSKEQIIEIENKLQELLNEESNSKKEGIGDPSKSILRPYQDEIINNWFKENEQGIYKMATGTGKTITAIHTIIRFNKLKKHTIKIIVCPYKALCDQWVNELINQSIMPIHCYESFDRWSSELNQAILNFKLNQQSEIIIVTTIDTFMDFKFQEKITPFRNKILLIVDECHHFGSLQLNQYLSNEIPSRLGLSATPEDDINREKNQRLYAFFKRNIPPEYDLGRALKEGWLSRYKYHPLLTSFDKDPNKQDEYEELLDELHEAFISGDMETYEKLIQKRDELLDGLEGKIPILEKLLDELNPSKLTHCIIYCANELQINDTVAKVLTTKGIKYAKITAQVSNAKERQKLLSEFKSGFLQVLLGIRVLDEGLDIPAVKTAIILKSSLSSRQSIQRRGRCLRIFYNAKGEKEDKDVNIYDLIVLPAIKFSNINLESFNKELIEKELQRIEEFINLADNSEEAKKIINGRIRYV